MAADLHDATRQLDSGVRRRDHDSIAGGGAGIAVLKPLRERFVLINPTG